MKIQTKYDIGAKTLPQAITDWFSHYTSKKDWTGDTALEENAEKIIREQAKQIELLREALLLADDNLAYCSDDCGSCDCVRCIILPTKIAKALAATSPNAEWEG